MGSFQVKFSVANPGDPSRRAKIEGIVDTGATLPSVPKDVLRSIGIKPSGRRVFQLADGGRRTLQVGWAGIGYGTESVPCLVAFAPAGSVSLLGAVALEELGLQVDPVRQTLKPSPLLLLGSLPA